MGIEQIKFGRLNKYVPQPKSGRSARCHGHVACASTTGAATWSLLPTETPMPPWRVFPTGMNFWCAYPHGRSHQARASTPFTTFSSSEI